MTPAYNWSHFTRYRCWKNECFSCVCSGCVLGRCFLGRQVSRWEGWKYGWSRRRWCDGASVVMLWYYMGHTRAHTPGVCQQPDNVVSESDTNECVEQRVQAAPHVGQIACYVFLKVGLGPFFAVYRSGCEYVNQKHHSVRKLEQEEKNHQKCHQTQSSLSAPTFATGTDQDASDRAVTHHHRHTRDAESCDLCHLGPQLPFTHFIAPNFHIAQEDLWTHVVLHGAEEQVWQAQEDRSYCNANRRQHAVKQRPRTHLPRGPGANHHQIAIDANASQQQQAAIGVDGVHTAV